MKIKDTMLPEREREGERGKDKRKASEKERNEKHDIALGVVGSLARSVKKLEPI